MNLGVYDERLVEEEATSGPSIASSAHLTEAEASQGTGTESEAQAIYHTGTQVAQGRTPQPQAVSHSQFPIGEDMPSQSSFDEEIRPLARKRTVRALTKNPDKDRSPVLCRVDIIEAAKSRTGWTAEQIASMCGRSKPTVLAALRAEPSCKLYDFCAVINVLGLEMADVFPVRASREKREDFAWLRGPHIDDNKEILLHEDKGRRRARG